MPARLSAWEIRENNVPRRAHARRLKRVLQQKTTDTTTPNTTRTATAKPVAALAFFSLTKPNEKKKQARSSGGYRRSNLTPSTVTTYSLPPSLCRPTPLTFFSMRTPPSVDVSHAQVFVMNTPPPPQRRPGEIKPLPFLERRVFQPGGGRGFDPLGRIPPSETFSYCRWMLAQVIHQHTPSSDGRQQNWRMNPSKITPPSADCRQKWPSIFPPRRPAIGLNGLESYHFT